MAASLTDQIEAITAESGVPWTRGRMRGHPTRHPDRVARASGTHIVDDTDRHRVLLVGERSPVKSDDADAAVSVLRAYASSQRIRNRVALSAIPCANPDGLSLGVGTRQRLWRRPICTFWRLPSTGRLLQPRDRPRGALSVEIHRLHGA